MVFDQLEETDTLGVYNVKDKPSGIKEHKIFLYSTHIVDIDKIKEKINK